MRAHLRLFPLILIMAALCLLGGCSDSPRKLGDEEYKSATGAAQTVQVVSADGLFLATLPEHARILAAAGTNLLNALQVAQAKPEELGTPLVTPAALAADPKVAADEAETEAVKRDEQVKQEQETPWYKKVLAWSGWVTVGAVGLWAARLLGVPGTQFLSDPLVRALGKKWIEPVLAKQAVVEQQVRDFGATVESSMVGRAGLAALDQILPSNAQAEIAGRIKQITKGQATTIEGLFKWLAQHHSQATGQGTAVKSVVDQIKDLMPTTALDAVLDQAVALAAAAPASN